MINPHKVLYQGKFSSIISPLDNYYEAHGTDRGVFVICKVKDKYSLRLEHLPAYSIMDKDNRNLFYSTITGSVEDDETFRDGMFRELLEEAGIEPISFNTISSKEIPIFKNLSARMKLYLLDIEIFDKIKPIGDGTKSEQLSKTVWLTIDEMKEIITNKDNYDMLFLLAYYMILEEL